LLTQILTHPLVGIGGVIHGMQGHSADTAYVTWCTMESSGVE